MSKKTLTRPEIEKLIPHRDPILLLDNVTAWEKDKWIEATYHAAEGSPHFTGHFPGNPILPGVLIIEAIAQSAAVLTSLSLDVTSEKVLYLFTGIKDVRLLAPVRPGDTLKFRAEKIRDKLGLYLFSGTAHVNDDLAVQATFTAKIVYV